MVLLTSVNRFRGPELRANDLPGVSVSSYSLPPASKDVMRRYFGVQLAGVEWGGDVLADHEADQLADKSNGWFVWAWTVCSTMKDDFGNISPRKVLDDTLYSQLTVGDSEALAELYAGAVSRSFPKLKDRKCMHRYLQAITVLQEPLPLADFSFLTGMDQRTVECVRRGLRALQTREPEGSDRLIHPATSQFHLSAIEYFEIKCTISDPSLNLSKTASHEMMALACIDILPHLFPPSQDPALDELKSPARYPIMNLLVHALHATPFVDPKSTVRWIEFPVLVRLHNIQLDTLRRWAQTLLRCNTAKDRALGGPPQHESWMVMRRLGECLLNIDELDNTLWNVAEFPNFSLACLQIAIHLCPGAAWTWCCLGRAYMDLAVVAHSPELCQEAIGLHRHALHLAAVDVDADKADIKAALAWAICVCHRLGGEVSLTAMDEALSLLHEVLQVRPHGHEKRLRIQRDLAYCLRQRFAITGGMEDLEKAIQIERKVLALCPVGNRGRAPFLFSLALSLNERFRVSKASGDLDEAVQCHRELLKLNSEPCNLPPVLNDLSVSLYNRFMATRSCEDLEEAIELPRQVLCLSPEGHTDRVFAMAQLSTALSQRFEIANSPADLEQATQLGREVLEFLNAKHRHSFGVHQFMAQANLATCIYQRFTLTKSLSDLEEVIQLRREAVKLWPEQQPRYLVMLNSFTASLWIRFQANNNLQDLEEPIELYREALRVSTNGTEGRAQSLHNFASLLRVRFEATNCLDDLEEAIRLGREALKLYPERNADRIRSLIGLADSLIQRYEDTDSIGDLEEANELRWEVLQLLPKGHPDRTSTLKCLLSSLQEHVEVTETIGDFKEASKLCEEVLEFLIEGHPDSQEASQNVEVILDFILELLKDESTEGLLLPAAV
ncbi:hypothetical protein NMY22_g14135 [Coprinellus aureogranulatus]|nr:hypothetical protein NMY22_g14135 [Coprinellus aureogranulatus]